MTTTLSTHILGLRGNPVQPPPGFFGTTTGNTAWFSRPPGLVDSWSIPKGKFNLICTKNLNQQSIRHPLCPADHVASPGDCVDTCHCDEYGTIRCDPLGSTDFSGCNGGNSFIAWTQFCADKQFGVGCYCQVVGPALSYFNGITATPPGKTAAYWSDVKATPASSK